jgi:RimJ/RimL family protein N-acetyltransferase
MYPGKKINLHALEPEHLENANAWINDPDIRKYLSVYIPEPRYGTERWYDSMMADPCHHVFAICTKSGRHIGNMGLHKIDWKNSNAELGILIGEQRYLSRGYGEDAVNTLLRFAFLELNLHRIYLSVWAFNNRAIACYEKCGFKKEGTSKDMLYHDGEYHDGLRMSILRNEFDGMEKGRKDYHGNTEVRKREKKK